MHTISSSGVQFTVADLRRYTRWCVWRLEWRGGKPVKVPFGCGQTEKTSARYSGTDPTTWLTWEQAERLCSAGAGYDPGFVLGDLGDGYCVGGVDLDACIGPLGLEPWALEIIAAVGPTYAEISPSNKGVKLWVLVRPEEFPEIKRVLGLRGKWGGDLFKFDAEKGEKKPGVEMYFGDRFFTLTERAAPGSIENWSVLGIEQAQAIAVVEKKWRPVVIGAGKTLTTNRPLSLSKGSETREEQVSSDVYQRLQAAASKYSVIAGILAGDPEAARIRDTSRSGWGFRLIGELAGVGWSDTEIDEACGVLEAGGVADWWAELDAYARQRQIDRAREKRPVTRETQVIKQLEALPTTIEQSQGQDNWKDSLQRSGAKGNPLRSNLNNGRIALLECPTLKGVYVFNEFSDRIFVERCPPYEKNWKGVRELKDYDRIQLAAWLQAENLQVTPNIMFEAIISVAMENPIDPVREYLEKLNWDGVDRLPTWMNDYLGVTKNSYSIAVATKSLIGAVARVFKPGCKMDTLTILEGEQGIYKSTTLQVLFGTEYFVDHMPDLHSKDAPMQLAGRWCVEHAELDKLGRTDASRVKSFITTQTDVYRRPYGHTTERVPRRCVFWGTMNDAGKGYFTDETGNRRYWPVRCADRRIDVRKLGDVRDQLWAEAVVRYHRSETWWLSGMAERQQQVQVGARLEEDVWAEPVKHFLNTIRENAPITVNEILRGIGKFNDRQVKSDADRIARIMRIEGWAYKRTRVGTERPWCFHCPKKKEKEKEETNILRFPLQ